MAMWAVSGRIVPERVDMKFGLFNVKVQSGEVLADVACSVSRSIFNVKINSTSEEMSIFQASDIVFNVLNYPVSYVAFMNCAHYTIVLDGFTNIETGITDAIGVFDPIFSEKNDAYTFLNRKFDANPVFKKRYNPQVVSAFYDLNQAVRDARRTPMYCRLAIEAVRHHFDPTDRKLTWQRRYIAGEQTMCDALRIDRDTMKRFDGYAARSRHGEQLIELDWPLRKEILEFSYEVVHRFWLYLGGNNAKEWELLTGISQKVPAGSKK